MVVQSEQAQLVLARLISHRPFCYLSGSVSVSVRMPFSVFIGSWPLCVLRNSRTAIPLLRISSHSVPRFRRRKDSSKNPGGQGFKSGDFFALCAEKYDSSLDGPDSRSGWDIYCSIKDENDRNIHRIVLKLKRLVIKRFVKCFFINSFLLLSGRIVRIYLIHWLWYYKWEVTHNDKKDFKGKLEISIVCLSCQFSWGILYRVVCIRHTITWYAE